MNFTQLIHIVSNRGLPVGGGGRAGKEGVDVSWNWLNRGLGAYKTTSSSVLVL